MICSLSSLVKLTNNCSVRVLGSIEPELQLYLERWGIASEVVSVKHGPWGCFILSVNNQEIALGPALANKLQVEVI